MATLTKVLFGPSASPADPGTWTGSPGSNSSASSGIGDAGTPVSGHTDSTFLSMTISGRNKSNANFWTWVGTWEDLGVPAGAIVTDVSLSVDYRCSAYTTGASSTVGPEELRDSFGTLIGTFKAGTSFSATSLQWLFRGGTTLAVPAGQQASNSTINLRLNDTLNTGASNSASVSLRQAYVSVTITYTAGAPPAQTVNPSGLASSATYGTPTTAEGGVSVSPSGLGSGVAFGSATAKGAISISVAGLGSSAAFGSSTIHATKTTQSTGLGSSASFGTPGALPGPISISASGLTSSGTLGTATVSGSGGPQTASVSGILSAAAFGSPSTVPGPVAITIGGLTSSATFDPVTVIASKTVAINGLGSAGLFGTPSPAPGGVTVSVAGLGSQANIGGINGGMPPAGQPGANPNVLLMHFSS